MSSADVKNEAGTAPSSSDERAAPGVANAGIGRTIHSDALDKLMGALGVTLSLAMFAGRAGYAVEAIVLLAALVAVAYFKAPARHYPTAEAVSAGMDLKGKVSRGRAPERHSEWCSLWLRINSPPSLPLRQVAIVTGPTSGIGVETARVLALRGARVVLAGRSAAKLRETKRSLEEQLAGRGVRAQFTTLELDLDDLRSVRKFAAAFQALEMPLHYLVLNAGVMALAERRSTAQGLERQVGINHVGHFLLATLLTETLQASAPSRVVCLSSSAYHLASHQFFMQDNPTLETTPYVDSCHRFCCHCVPGDVLGLARIRAGSLRLHLKALNNACLCAYIVCTLHFSRFCERIKCLKAICS